ncbi:MAG: aspartate carbamoyltransferase catalytic subunit [Gracilibacteraceae bacterium]|jgi:aspartate carbamoyltransferase catalytic subunit|nr:aspartate carbamoyltransferase catalytic subunit [Gracilibacteraceae bacterium]
MSWRRKDLLDIETLTACEMRLILDTAVSMKEVLTRPVKKLPTLRGKAVTMLFYEPSTRTRVSFETAAKILGADTASLAVAQSSVSKGESLLDTAKTLVAMNADLVVVRHASSGAPHFLAQNLPIGVINAGDGQHAHPTQALLDIYSLREKWGDVAGRKVLIVGDILHSRVARSNAVGLTKLGAEVVLVGPPTLLPPEMAYLGVRSSYDFDRELAGAHAVMALRLQLERQRSGLFPSLREYNRLYGLTRERLAKAAAGCLVLHPGPVNRGVEIMSDVADCPQSVIETQVTNGVAVRMALIYLLTGGGAVEDVVA